MYFSNFLWLFSVCLFLLSHSDLFYFKNIIIIITIIIIVTKLMSTFSLEKGENNAVCVGRDLYDVKEVGER